MTHTEVTLTVGAAGVPQIEQLMNGCGGHET
jgi:hypothetical protein